MSKRKNYHDDFEMVYLRHNTLRRFLPLADQTIVNDEAFKKVTRHLADRFFNKHRGLMLRHGFDFNDIHNMCQLWGVAFTGVKPVIAPATRDRDYYYIMMNFISQRLGQFCNWTIKKFNSNDVVNENVRPSSSGHSRDQGEAPMDTMIFHIGLDQPVDQEDEMADQLDANVMSRVPQGDSFSVQLEKLQDALSVVNAQLEKSPTGHIPVRLQRQADQILERIKKLQGQRQEQKNNFKQFKELLVGNIDKYRDSLAHYATSRHTSFEARKKAREYCKKYGINYVEWVEQKIKDSKGDPSEFVL